MEELWQLYSEQGLALNDQGARKDVIFSQGLLHGASHVWIWRQNVSETELLVQKRASTKRTWPNRYDISAAGHIDLGEDPLSAAIREAKEEINLTLDSSELKLFSIHRTRLIAENGSIENEFQWLYSLELSDDARFELQQEEADALEWISLNTFKTTCYTKEFVPHGRIYYETVIKAIEQSNLA